MSRSPATHTESKFIMRRQWTGAWIAELFQYRGVVCETEEPDMIGNGVIGKETRPVSFILLKRGIECRRVEDCVIERRSAVHGPLKSEEGVILHVLSNIC